MTTLAARSKRTVPPVKGARFGVGLAALLAVGGCDDPNAQVRSYSVPKETPPPAPAVAPVGATGDMAWSLPAGWRAVENTNTMRFATLQAGTAAETIEVAISRLGGTAGGVPANVNRWRGQIGLPAASTEDIAHAAIPIETPHATGLVVDLVGPDPADEEAVAMRMFAAIFPVARETWFIKTTGPAPVLETHRDGFLRLCESVRFGA
ncbi:MAG: hypothetical protein HKO59_12425, partial [Phycisphaerales bacterium]|nr:hypothetical protein [Phycisphaerae bacterium]NNF42599.1 hypothetical protein [Phycisphaerales bacterium]NNM26768.1 hypothetical protein [Phycisphaerales bacterium]